MNTPIRVLIVDDSTFMRLTIARHLAREPGVIVVGSARDGIEALELIPRCRPDVVTLDVEMPRLDGLGTLNRIMREYALPVVMLSSRTQRGAPTTIQALMRGAVDFVAKPDSQSNIHSVVAELAQKIRIAARAQHQNMPISAPTPQNVLHCQSRTFCEGDALIVVGASTGGPRALTQLFANLSPLLDAAIVVVQHMPAGFTHSLAQRLDMLSAFTVQEATPESYLARGLALIAPGDFHLRFDGTRVVLDQSERRNFVRPSVDVTMESAAEQFAATVIGVILTGMGSDGLIGARRIKAAGGHVLAEHESSCTVYGMPRSVVDAGIADYVAPITKIAESIQQLARNERLGV